MAEYGSLRRTLALRMILLGEAGAGKTCLYHWIKYKAFRDTSINTTGDEATPPSLVPSRQRQYDQYNLHINISPTVRVALTVVDTADAEKYQSLTAHYYRRANVVLLVCSLDDEGSLNRLNTWYREAQYYVDEQETIYAVCGIKSDLRMDEREVTLEMMQSFARHIEIPETCVFQVSAKTGLGVNDMLQTACSVALEKLGGSSEPQSLHVPSGEHSTLLGSNSTVHDDFHAQTSHKLPCSCRCCSSRCVIT